jgi:PAS domain S-box-containing protein
MNYLEMCDRATGAHAAKARRAAVGIRAVTAGEQDEFILEYTSPSPGAQRWFGLRISRFRHRAALRIVVAHFEVTALKQTELALRESEAGLRLLVAQLPALVTTTDRELRFVSAVGASLQHLGLRLDQLIGHSLTELITPIGQNLHTVDAHRRALTGETVGFEAEWLGHTYQARVEPLRGSDGSIVGTVGVGVDVSDLKRAQQERLQSAARTTVLAEVSRAFVEAGLDTEAVVQAIVRLISETMEDGCVLSLLSADGRSLQPQAIHHSNPEAGALVERLFGEAAWAADNALVAEVMGGGNPLRVWLAPTALRDLIPESYRPYLDRFAVYGVVAVPLRVEGAVTGLLAVWRDRLEPAYTIDDEVLMQEIADRAALAIANARLYTELERRVQTRTIQLEAANQELETFSYSVSHDLRAPLRSITGFAKALRDDYGEALALDARHLLERVLAGGQRMEELIDDLLVLSRTSRSDMHRRSVSLSDLAREVGEELQRAHADRQVTLVVASGVTAEGDARLLRVVMDNLLANAWKYTARHATAQIEFGVAERDGERVYFVRDDGAGFDMQYADKLFGPFQRLHSSQEFSGSGIGLATVQRIIVRHGGRIWAHAGVEQGATFSFTLPAGLVQRDS